MPSHKQRPFFFALEDEASKKGQGLAHQALAPGDHALRKGSRSSARSKKPTKRFALLFQTLNELKEKGAAPLFVFGTTFPDVLIQIKQELCDVLFCYAMARTKKPKVSIKRQKTSLGWAYQKKKKKKKKKKYFGP